MRRGRTTPLRRPWAALLLLAAPAMAVQEAGLLLRYPAADPAALVLVLVVDPQGGDAAALPALQATARSLLETQSAGHAGLVHPDAQGRVAALDPAPVAAARPALLAALDALPPDGGPALEELLGSAAAMIIRTGACAAVQPLLVSASRPSRRLLALVPGLQWIAAGTILDTEQARALLLAPVTRPDAPQLLAEPLLPPPSGQPPRHGDAVYLGLFEAGGREAWAGNLHRFRHGGGRIIDRHGREALDPAGLRLLPGAAGAAGDWTVDADAGRPGTGGAAARLPPAADRRIWSNLAGAGLADSGNAVQADNPLALAALGALPPEQASAAIEHLRDGAASGLGDPLHGPPVLLPGGDAEAGQDLLFLATNTGVLHAFDADSGRERWAFIPARLLPRLALLLENPPAPDGRSHGLDGGLRLVSPATPGAPRAVLLAAMRRGGDGLYALDVSNPDQPRLLWELDAGAPGLSALGETWSLPVAARIRTSGTIRDVAIFGGGHDVSQDRAEPGPSPRGNALYVVDLVTGELLASAGAAPGHTLVLPAMRYAIPAAPRVIDLDQDGLADRVYVGDTGGQLWRLDFGDGPGGGLAGGLLAELGGTVAPDDPAAARRFYATPDVVAITGGDRLPALQVQLGSGHYPRLLDRAVADAFFAVRDRIPAGQLSDPARRPLRPGDLVDVGEAEPTGDAAGWRLALDAQPGEKVLRPALSLNGRVYFSSFSPGLGERCGEPVGHNRLYEVELRDGRPPRAPPGEPVDPGQPPARARLLEQQGIAPGPSLLWPDGAPPLVCAGIECQPADPALEAPRRSWWRWSSRP